MIDRKFSLNNAPGSLGLRCVAAGLSLAGVPLLLKTQKGFVPRSSYEIDALMKAAYGLEDGEALMSSLDTVARALNRGELGLAMIAAVLMKLPELDWEAAARLAGAEDRLGKYNPDEPRDRDGRWTDGSSDAPSKSDEASPKSAAPITGVGEQGTDRHNSPANEDQSSVSDSTMGLDGDKIPDALRIMALRASELEGAYDGLGPIEFAKQVTQFGTKLGRDGNGFTPLERQDALAEYAFLQNRLSFWLRYDYKPPRSQNYLLSAALTLYQGAVTGGVVGVGGERGGFPPSMIAVAGAALGADGGQPTIGLRRPDATSAVEPVPIVPLGSSDRVGELGGVVENSNVGIKWNGGISNQGLPWEVFLRKVIPWLRQLRPGTKGFDFYNEETREAISNKTLNTLSVGYIDNPKKIYGTLKGYVDSAAEYIPRTSKDLDAAAISKKTIHLAVPEYTSPTQWGQITKAILYGKSRRVAVYVTRIRDDSD